MKLYKAMVCPHLDFGMTLVSSSYYMNVNVLKSIFRRAIKLINIKTLQDKTYKQHLTSLKLPTLVYCKKENT